MHLPKIKFNRLALIHIIILIIVLVLAIFAVESKNRESNLNKQIKKIQEELTTLENQDQYLINQELKEEIKNIQNTFGQAVKDYEKMVDLSKTTDKINSLFAQALSLLSKRNYSSASAVLTDLEKEIQKEQEKSATSFQIPASVTESNNPPASGFQRQKIVVGGQAFMVDIISADLNSTRVIVDTASETDCSNDCPVLSLADYVARNGAFAGVNGSYFCPATYPQCADKKNSFDTLLMNKNKRYFNSDNNVYSTVPAVIFMGNTARFVNQSLEWGRDTGVDAVIANRPLLTLNNQIVFGGDSDAKHNNKGGRSFVGITGSTVYIGVVRNTTVLESAQVLNTLGITNALNLDDGGSTALWYSGYKVGPGRNLPNALLLVKK